MNRNNADRLNMKEAVREMISEKKEDISQLRLLVTGLDGSDGELDQLSYQFKRRGFIPLYTLKQGQVASMILTLSPKLYTKLVILNNYPVKDLEHSSLAQATKVFSYSRKIIVRSGIKHTAVWLMHQSEKLCRIGGTNATTGPDLDMLNQYFGSQIALYFGWLDFYSSFLRYPALFGAILFAYQIFSGEVDTPGSPYFLLFLAVWSTCFLEYWKQQNAKLAHKWEVLRIDEEQKLKQIAKTAGLPQPDRLFRFAITIPIILFMILVLLRLMVYFIHLMDNATETYGNSILGYWPTIVYSLLPVVAGAIYDYVVVLLNNFECHPTPVDEEYYLVMKQFAFQFVNRYCALIYTGFYLQDLTRLRTLLASMLITNALLDNFMEIFSHQINSLVSRLTKRVMTLFKKKSDQDQTNVETETPPIGNILHSTLKPEEAQKFDQEMKEAILKELTMEDYNLRSDYLELILQYGYVTMFAVVFPIAPALAYLNNLMEAKVDFLKLASCRRPPLQDRSTIGAWYTCLSMLNYAAVLSNCYLLCIVSSNLSAVLPPRLKFILDSDYARFILLVVLEHSLLLLRMILSAVIDDIPREVEEIRAKDVDTRQKKLATERLLFYIQQANGDVPITNSLSTSHIERHVVAAKLSTESATPLGYTSLFLSSVISLPLLMQTLGISPAWYLPLSTLALSYLKADKNRHDRKAAIQIVSDYETLKYSLEEMPSWVQHSDVQTVQWLNDILEKLWPSISSATEAVIMQTLQPILDQNCPSYLTSLEFSRITLGTIAPVIVGVRHCRTTAEDNCVRLDIELKWAGNPEIVLDVGYKTLPLSIELSDIRLSTILRLEFYSLINSFPCFEAITVSCMHKPFIDFSFEIGSLNVMNLGAAEYNVASGVNNLIRSIVSSFALHPIKYVVYNSGNRSEFNELVPIGLLKLTIISAKNLKVADLLTSDPFVQIKFMDKIEQTKVIYKTLNPVWNESFNIPVFDKETQFVELTVFDYDLGMAPDFLGKLTINLDTLPINDVKEMDLSLNEVDTGTLQLSCEFISFKKTKPSTASGSGTNAEGWGGPETEVFFDFSKDALASDEIEMEDGHLVGEGPGGAGGDGIAMAMGTARAPNPTQSSSPGANGALDSQTSSSPSRDSSRLSSRGIGGLLTVTKIEGKNFKGHSMLSALKPYVIFSLGTIKQTTAVHKVSSDYQVTFDETFHLTVQDPFKSTLTIKVMHDNLLRGDSLLGEVAIPLPELMKDNGAFVRVFHVSDKMELSVTFTWLASS